MFLGEMFVACINGTKPEAKSQIIRDQYVAHIAKMLVLLGEPEGQARQNAASVLAIETEMAKASLSKVDKRDPYKIFHNMNGTELCKALKRDIDTSHIPVLMLTAKTALASQKDGLDSGADYYFAKPLNMELLILTIRNRFEQSAKLRDRYTRESHIEAMELVHSEKDKEFMSCLLKIIDAELVNPDFSR